MKRKRGCAGQLRNRPSASGTAAQAAKNITDLKRARDLADVREKYGSAIVDYALKNGETALAPDTAFTAAVTGKR